MRVLVTGAAGFLGREFASRHLEDGDAVVGVDDMSNPYSYWALPATSRLELDLAEYLAGEVAPFDLAYHFAAPVGGRVKIEGDPLFNADSLRLDSAFFRWAVTHVGTAVYPSSSAVYGVSLQEGSGRQLQEGMFHPANPNWFAPDEMYGFTKLAGEVLAWKSAAYGLNTLCIRPFSGYGEGQSSEYPVPSILERARRREDPLVVWGTGEQKRDFIHVSDLVGATIARLRAGVDGYQSMNIGSGFAVSFNDIARAAAKLVGYEPTIQNDEGKPQGVDSRFCDPSRMQMVYQPTVSLSDGLGRVLRYLDAQDR